MRPESSHHPAEVPPGYPREFERELTLSDGRAILIRPIVPGDGEQLAHAIRTADPETLYRRFLGAPPRITPALLEHLCTVDYRKRFALVAVDPWSGVGVGIARYETVAAGTAEVSIVVDPAWRRVGLATVLIELLADAALGRGIQTFRADYLAENRPVSALLGLAGGGRQTIQAGFAEAAVALDRYSVTAVPSAPRPLQRSRESAVTRRRLDLDRRVAIPANMHASLDPCRRAADHIGRLRRMP